MTELLLNLFVITLVGTPLLILEVFGSKVPWLNERKGVVMTDYGTLLRDHVTLRCRSIDRIFLQAYVPRLQAVGDVCTFLRWQRKYPIPSSAAFGKIGDAYVKAVYRFAGVNHIPVVHFKKGEKKEETARPYLEAAAREGKDRVVRIGIAQEKASIWRSWPRERPRQ